MDGRLQMLGIVQEQHADRARLFMQWKQMNWPLMFDPLNQLGVDVVPITLLLDEGGVIRFRNPDADDVKAFLVTDYQTDESFAPTGPRAVDLPRVREAARAPQPGDPVGLADQLVLWGGAGDLSAAIELYQSRLEAVPDDGVVSFRAGVAYRKRYDSSARQEGDFQRASQSWTRALELNPNQYIWRRRIQQYGPRLEKPYAFFDWVQTARQEIRVRDERPHPLLVEPRGAELANPSRKLDGATDVLEPDPRGKIVRDHRGYVVGSYTTVPAVVKPGGAVRVHVELKPDSRRKAHWNNEVEGVEFWVGEIAGLKLDQHYQQLALPSAEVSTETRNIEFELRVPEDAEGPVELNAYALYYVCEDRNGTCLYRRLDLPIKINVTR